ncbi:MAG: LPS-assembly protein LptD [Elusimicrobia bacterium]|nr:LPS-assembly protein LptD [Elusimicrobiota bacterium]
MFHKKIIFLLLILCLSFIFAPDLFCAYEVNIKADSLTYKQDDEIITASGNVELEWTGKIIKADNIEMHIKEQNLQAEGHVELSEEKSLLLSDKIQYDMAKEHGDLENTFGTSSSIYFKAEKMIKVSSDTYEIENVKLSNCDLDDPHHYAFAKKGIFIVDKKITIYKATYYVGKVPVFYFPKYTRNLAGSDSKFSYEIEPGYTNDGGISAKAKLKYKFTDKLNSALLLDYLGTKGEGIGLETNYYDKNNIKATLYAYGTQDRKEDSQRWKIRPSYWQRINDLWTIQSHAEFVSDSYFNNRYSMDDWDRVLNKRRSYISVTRQSTKSNLRIMSELYQIYNPITDKIQNGSYLILPQVYYSLYPAKTLGALSSFTFNFENKTNYEYFFEGEDYDYRRISAIADYNITKDYRVTKKMTVKPTLGINGTFYDSVNPEDDDKNFTTRYYGSLNTRYRLTWWMDWNLSYEAKLRSDINRLNIDTDSFDKGVEKHAIMFNNYIYTNSNLIIRNVTGYDLRNIEDLGYIDWYPLITELTYVPTSKVTLYFKQTQDLHPFKFNSVQFDSMFGKLERFYFKFSAFYYEIRPDEVDLVSGIGFWLNSKWRLDYLIRITCNYEDDIEWSKRDQELKIYRDLHCFNLGASFRLREEYFEFYFKFEMKSNVPTLTKKDGTKEIDQEFYPWR